MFWFEKKPEIIKNPKEFISAVLRLFTTCLKGEGGIQIGRYVVEIKDKKTKGKFLNAIEKMIENPNVENWIKEELEIAKEVIKTWKKEG